MPVGNDIKLAENDLHFSGFVPTLGQFLQLEKIVYANE
jgi:hypothetical protein